MGTDRLAVLRRALGEQARALVLWGIAFAVVAGVYLSYYQQIAADPDIVESVQDLPGGLSSALNFTDLASPAGYLRGTVFGLLGPLLMVLFAVLAGTRAIAGDEEAGVLDVFLTHPLSRRRLAAERWAAIAVQVLLLAAVLWAVVTLLAAAQDLGLGTGDLAAASLGLGLLGLFFATLALAVGGATGRRTVTVATTAGVAVVTYLVNAVVGQLDAVSWLRWLSPWHWFQAGDPLTHGLQPGLLLLAAGSAVLLAGTLVVFDRRDLGV